MVGVIQAFLQGLDKPIMLWLLSRGPRHGYGLIKELKRLTGHKLKPGIVYPFLHWLEQEGFAVGEWVENGRRHIKYYSLTKRGERLLSRIRDLFKRPLKEAITDFLLEKRRE